MAKRTRIAPDAIDVLGAPKYQKARPIEPLTAIGAAAPAQGQEPLSQLATGLEMFNVSGLKALSARTGYAQKAAMEQVPALQAAVKDTTLEISEALDKIDGVRWGNPALYSAAIKFTGATEAPRDLDKIYRQKETQDWINEHKDAEDFPQLLEDHIMGQAIERLDPDKRVSKYFRTGYDPAYEEGAKKRNEVYVNLWDQRKKSAVRQAGIKVARNLLTDVITADGTKQSLANFKEKAYEGLYGPWAISKKEGITYNREFWSNVITPVFELALENQDIDVDELTEIYRKVGSMRRTTEKGSTELWGNFKQEALLWYAKAAETTENRRRASSNRRATEQKEFRETFQGLLQDFEGGGFEPGVQEKLSGININSYRDVDRHNVMEFLDVVSADSPYVQSLMDSGEGSQAMWTELGTQIRVVKNLMNKFAAEEYDNKGTAQLAFNSAMDATFNQDPYLQSIAGSFRDQYMPLIIGGGLNKDLFLRRLMADPQAHVPIDDPTIESKEGGAYPKADGTYLTLEELYRQRHPNYNKSTLQLQGALRGFLDRKFFSDTEAVPEALVFTHNKYKEISSEMENTGIVPKGAEEWIRNSIFENIHGDEKLDQAGRALLSRIDEQQEVKYIFTETGHPTQYQNLDILINKGKQDEDFYTNGIDLYLQSKSDIRTPGDPFAIGGAAGALLHPEGAVVRASISEMAPAVMAVNALLTEMAKERAKLAQNWLDKTRATGITDPTELAVEFNKFGLEEIKDGLERFLDTQIPLQSGLLKQRTDPNAPDADSIVNPDGSTRTTTTDEGSSADTPASTHIVMRDHSRETARKILEGNTQQDIDTLSVPEGQQHNVAVEAYMGPKGDELLKEQQMVREYVDKTKRDLSTALVANAKMIRSLGGQLEDPEKAKKYQEEVANKLNLKNQYIRLIKEHESFDYKNLTNSDGDAYFFNRQYSMEVGDREESIEIFPFNEGISFPEVRIVDNWAELGELNSTFSTLNKAIAEGDQEAFDALKETDQWKRLKQFAGVLSAGGIQILSDNRNIRKDAIRKLGKASQAWRADMIAHDTDALPGVEQLAIKDQTFKNFFESDQWADTGYKVPSGKNFQYAGEEYSPQQAGHVRSILTNNQRIANEGLDVEGGVTLKDFYRLYAGLSGNQITKAFSMGFPYTSTPGMVGQSGTFLVPFDYESPTSEDYASHGFGPMKTVVAFELTLADMGYEKPLLSAQKFNPFMDFKAKANETWHPDDPRWKYAPESSKIRSRSRRGGVSPDVPAWSPDSGDPPPLVAQRRQRGDFYEPTSGKRRQSGFLADMLELFTFGMADTADRFRSKEFDDRFHQYFNLLSGGSKEDVVVKMSKPNSVHFVDGVAAPSLLPGKDVYSNQPLLASKSWEERKKAEFKSPDLARAYNTLLKGMVLSDGFDSHPFLKNFNVHPLALPLRASPQIEPFITEELMDKEVELMINK